ncbi:MAG: YdeI/OmpD-associated family protein [Acidobacteria bacterium]|nr:YdeI/OmpD-associated family protein [Acidobacteriota bacterium]
MDIPADLRQALDADPEIAEFFAGLSHTHRREYVNWINEVKTAPTREGRVQTTVRMLREKGYPNRSRLSRTKARSRSAS